MSLYTIADLHLSENEDTNKPMDVFGARWKDHAEKIKKNWNAIITADDTVVLPGDLSWALTIDEAIPDFLFLDALPGRKIIGKGNHDYWWTSVSKMKDAISKAGVSTVDFLLNNAFLCGSTPICGTRGWFFENAQKMPENADYAKLAAREAGRLRASLDAAKKLSRGKPEVFLHFPPVFGDYKCDEILAVIKEYSVSSVYYGHIHGQYELPPEFSYENCVYRLISADFLNFIPRLVRIDP